MTKVAILIDGGFFLVRLKSVRPDVDIGDAAAVDQAVGQLVESHLKQIFKTHGGKSAWELLYRCFYYDAKPYSGKAQTPVRKAPIDYAKTAQALMRGQLFDLLRKRPNFAVRLGEVILERSWVMTEDAQKSLLDGTRPATALTDDDFRPGLRQKAVDMRLGLDMAALTLKKQVDTLILVTGDSDFVPAAKLARREGVRIILDPMWLKVAPSLFEHIDLLRSGFARPGKKDQNERDDDVE